MLACVEKESWGQDSKHDGTVQRRAKFNRYGVSEARRQSRFERQARNAAKTNLIPGADPPSDTSFALALLSDETTRHPIACVSIAACECYTPAYRSHLEDYLDNAYTYVRLKNIAYAASAAVTRFHDGPRTYCRARSVAARHACKHLTAANSEMMSFVSADYELGGAL